MSNKIQNSKELKKLTALTVKYKNSLADTSKEQPSDGYIENWFGEYWDRALYLKYISAFLAVVAELEKLNQPTSLQAAQYSFAGAYRQGLQLDNAAAICTQVLNVDENKPNFQSMLAFIEARRGNEKEARRLAALVDANPSGASFRVYKPDFEAAIEKGKSWNGQPKILESQ